MIKKSLRLQTIASFVEPGATVIDIGCDHALLPLFLVQQNQVKKAIAADISGEALKQAQRNIKRAQLEKQIELRQGDGLAVLKANEVTTIIISGLGYNKIINILKGEQYKFKGVNQIIIQTNTKPVVIRKYLSKIGFYIEQEAIICEKGIYYLIISFKKGKQKYTKQELLLGPYLMNTNLQVYQEYLTQELNYQNQLLKVVPYYCFKKRRQLKYYAKVLKRYLTKNQVN